MNVRILGVWLALALLLAGSSLPGHAAEPAARPASPARDGVSAGGGYRVVVAPAPVSQVVLVQTTGSASGGRYRLEPVPGAPAASADLPAAGSAAGCCCIYYPRIRR